MSTGVKLTFSPELSSNATQNQKESNTFSKDSFSSCSDAYTSTSDKSYANAVKPKSRWAEEHITFLIDKIDKADTDSQGRLVVAYLKGGPSQRKLKNKHDKQQENRAHKGLSPVVLDDLQIKMQPQTSRKRNPWVMEGGPVVGQSAPQGPAPNLVAGQLYPNTAKSMNNGNVNVSGRSRNQNNAEEAEGGGGGDPMDPNNRVAAVPTDEQPDDSKVSTPEENVVVGKSAPGDAGGAGAGTKPKFSARAPRPSEAWKETANKMNINNPMSMFNQRLRHTYVTMDIWRFLEFKGKWKKFRLNFDHGCDTCQESFIVHLIFPEYVLFSCDGYLVMSEIPSGKLVSRVPVPDRCHLKKIHMDYVTNTLWIPCIIGTKKSSIKRLSFPDLRPLADWGSPYCTSPHRIQSCGDRIAVLTRCHTRDSTTVTMADGGEGEEEIDVTPGKIVKRKDKSKSTSSDVLHDGEGKAGYQYDADGISDEFDGDKSGELLVMNRTTGDLMYIIDTHGRIDEFVMTKGGSIIMIRDSGKHHLLNMWNHHGKRIIHKHVPKLNPKHSTIHMVRTSAGTFLQESIACKGQALSNINTYMVYPIQLVLDRVFYTDLRMVRVCEPTLVNKTHRLSDIADDEKMSVSDANKCSSSSEAMYANKEEVEEAIEEMGGGEVEVTESPESLISDTEDKSGSDSRGKKIQKPEKKKKRLSLAVNPGGIVDLETKEGRKKVKMTTKPS